MLNDGNHFQLDKKIVVAFIVTFGAQFLQFLKRAQLTCLNGPKLQISSELKLFLMKSYFKMAIFWQVLI